jgi:hypothetical protein
MSEFMINAHPPSFNGRKHSGPTRQQRRDRRYALIVGVALFLGLGATICALIVAMPRYSPGSTRNAASGPEPRTGNIVNATSSRCRDFDNDTGRVSRAGKPCENGVPLDGNGEPIPVGTARRLDAISKSFLHNK